MDVKKFLNKNNYNKDIVVVQGLGFVGAVMSLVVSNSSKKDYAVIGVDRKESIEIIDSINNGIFPIKSSDPKIEEYYQNSIEKKNFLATYDTSAYSYASVIIVDINLDVQKISDSKGNLNSYDVDLNPFKNAIRTIGKNCKEDVLVLVETTVPPGTCMKVVKPILEEELRKRNLSVDKIKIGHSYERVMPGPEYINSIKNFYRVYSGIDENSAIETEKFLKTIISTSEYPLTRLVNTNATEMAKVLENSYRAMNIAFMVEWTRFAEESGVNLFEIIDAIRMRPTHNNMMYPGIGVGGYCLTKDTLLAGWSRKKLFDSNASLSLSENSISINNKMPKYAFDFLILKYSKEVIGKDVLLLGVAYRGDVSDTRSSPVESFFNCCEEAGCNVIMHDPYVSFWEEKQIKVPKNLGEILKPGFDVVVITAGHSYYRSRKFIDHLMVVKPKIVYDTLGHLSEEDIHRLQRVSKVCVIGRDDLD